MTSLAGQTYAFLMTILAGGAVGLVFDVYRVLRSTMRAKQLATALTDLLYWIVVTPIVFSMLLAGNWGELRFYVLIGLALGLLLYFQVLSSTVIWFLINLFKGIGQITASFVYFGTRLFIYPFVVIRDTFGRRSGPAVPGTAFRRSMGTRASRNRARMRWHRFAFLSLFNRFGK